MMDAAKNSRKSLLRNPGVQTILASLLCILLGLVIGYIVLMIINPAGAGDALMTVLKNFLRSSKANLRLKNMGNTLIKTAPLIMCSLSILFAYKVGLFNIGAAGQYVIGAGAALYCALVLHLPWYVCMVAAMLAGGLLGAVSGMLKAYRNVNEVISCIMLNWISLYVVNTLLMPMKNPSGKDTFTIISQSKGSIIPGCGLETLLNNKNVTIAIPLAVVIAILVWIVLSKTKLGYELRATGLNRQAAKYSGMKERFNIILTMGIAGGLAGLGASMLYLSDFTQWGVTQSSIPAMGFNGIAAAFLGGLNPFGVVLSSFFIQHITDGGAYLTSTQIYCAQTSDLISAVIIYLCGFVLFFKLALNKWLDKREETAAKATAKGGDHQ